MIGTSAPRSRRTLAPEEPPNDDDMTTGPGDVLTGSGRDADGTDGDATRVAGVRQMLAAVDQDFDPTLPGLFAGDPPAEFVSLTEAMAADARPESMRTALLVMAEADQRDLLPRIAVPTLLIWGELDARAAQHRLGSSRRRSRTRSWSRSRALGTCATSSNPICSTPPSASSAPLAHRDERRPS
jgi:pimeloyl-ACP methyl ester carboxylesterase